MNTYDYTGKEIYIGIDVHKKTYSCASICNGHVVKKDSMPGNPVVILNYLKNTFKGATINSVYEAGFTGFYLHRFLVSQGINNCVVHPGSIEVCSRDRVKTDKRDALKMAIQLSTGRLKGINVPDQEREEKRSVTRLRTSIVKLRHQVGQQFKALLFTQGLIDYQDDNKVSQKWLLNKVAEVNQKGFSDDFCYSVNEYAEQWIQLNHKLKEIGLRLTVQAQSEKGLQAIYESVPGIGPLHARQLANELGDMKQFANEKRLFSYAGLTPCEYSSGESVRRGSISRQGKSILRKILIEAAWIAITKDPSLKDAFDRLANRRGKKRAIVAVARRLVGRIRSCVLTGTLYEIKSTREGCSLQETVV